MPAPSNARQPGFHFRLATFDGGRRLIWIWQEARALVKDIYGDFGSDTHAERDYGFRGQIQTAGISIMNNIAEGFERSTDPDKARFLDVAKGSAGEVRSMYYLAEDIRYVSKHW